MEISSLIQEFGAYYEKSGQNKKRVLQMITQKTVTPSYATPMRTDETIFKLGKGKISSIVQPFQKGWTPKNAMEVTPNEIRLYEMKVDEDVYPDEIEATWLGFLAGEDVDRKNWPLIKWMIENYYIPQIDEDMENEVYFKGVYKAPQNGTPGAPKDSMNGLDISLDQALAKGAHSIDIGTLDPDTIFDQVELFVEGISEIYQNTKMNVNMSPKWARAYLRDKRAQGFYQKSSDKEINLSIDFTPQMVTPLPSMANSDVIWATPKTNFIHLKKKSQNKGKFGLESSKRNVAFYCDWWEGLGFGINEAIWTNKKLTTGSGSAS